MRLHLNTTGMRYTLCYAAVLLGIVALLIGCPDSMGNDDNNGGNDDAIGTPTEATRVQSAASGAITIDTITLNWAVPSDTVGLLGVTISEENNAGSLSDSVAVDADATTYQVTDLEAGTAYTFTITTRYSDVGKNNSVAIVAMTALSTEVQRVALVVSETTSDSVTIAWEDPADTDGYTGVTISAVSTVGDLDMNMPRTVAQGTNTLTISDLAAETEYMLMLTFTTEYSTDKGSSSDHTIPVTTQSTLVTNVIASTITSDSVTLSWDDPEDTVGYTGVTISATATVGDLDMNIPRTVAKDTNTLTISNLAAEAEYMLVLTFTTEYSTNKGSSSNYTIPVTTQSNYITAFVPSTITAITITLSWANPEDRVGYAGVTISANPAHGDLSNEIQINASQGSIFGQLAVTGLTAATEYMFTIAARYTGGKTAGADATITVTSALPIDADNDNLIDITSVERLYNIRYNLDLSDGRYKSSAHDVGIQCGTAENTDCVGYELIHNLDFASADSYQSGIVNTNWRPQDSSGMILTQENASSATNAGWEPIGDIGNSFATTFEGNGYTISNLYARNTNNSTPLTGISLFGIIRSTATINTVGIVDASVYGGNAEFERVGGLVGFNGGTINASYTIDSTADGGAGDTDHVGGLVGQNASGTITASYATGSMVHGGMGNDNVGGLVGQNASGTITASYASGSTVDGGMGNDFVGGLLGLNSGSISASYVTNSTAIGSVGSDFVGGLVGNNHGPIIASYATGSTADGGMEDDNVGGLVGHNGIYSVIIASYASSGTADGGMGGDAVGGLVGDNDIGTIIASYASGTANGGANNTDTDSVGGLVGDNSVYGTIIASYATAAANGGTGGGSNDSVGSLVGRNTATLDTTTATGTVTASYGFGTTDNVGTAGLSQGPDGRPTDDTVASGTLLAGAALLLAPDPSDTTNTAVAAAWNQASSNTAGVWHFGTATDIPTLRYADYDGGGDIYGCGSDSMATIVIPDSVPDGAGGTIAVNCGTTLLPGQR